VNFNSYIKSLKTHWVLLVQAASLVSLTIRGFVNPPDYFDPVATASETKRFAAFIVALLIGVFFYFGHKWSLKKNARGWAFVTVVLALLLIGSDQIFREFKTDCTCRYDEQTILIGTEYTELGKSEYADDREAMPCEEIVMNFTGRVDFIWTPTSINSCRRKLTLSYLMTFSLAALSLLSALQIVKCQNRRR
jgi:hypothetical protein